MATAGVLWFGGDLLSQNLQIRSQKTQIEEMNKKSGEETLKNDQLVKKSTFESLDLKRLMIMTSFGVFAAGPAYTIWYSILDTHLIRYFQVNMPNLLTTKWRIAGMKLFADMIIFDIPFLSLFFISTKLAEGYNLEACISNLKKDLIPTYLVDLCVWTPVQLVNFRMIPVLFQPVVVNCVNLGWNCYLSSVQHND